MRMPSPARSMVSPSRSMVKREVWGSGLERAAEKYARLARLCGLTASPRALSAALGRLLGTLNMPRSLKVDDPAAIAQAALADVCTAANPRTPSTQELAAIVRELAV